MSVPACPCPSVFFSLLGEGDATRIRRRGAMRMKSRSGSRVALSALALLIAAGCASTPPPVEQQPVSHPAGPLAWVALGSEGPVARAIVTDPQGVCPEIEVSDGSAPRPL